jgi:hypothetical protein
MVEGFGVGVIVISSVVRFLARYWAFGDMTTVRRRM